MIVLGGWGCESMNRQQQGVVIGATAGGRRFNRSCGRQANRRVEVAIWADEKLKKVAQEKSE